MFTIKYDIEKGVGFTMLPNDFDLRPYYNQKSYQPFQSGSNKLKHVLYGIIRKSMLRIKLNLIQRRTSKHSKLLDYGGGLGHFAQYCSKKGIESYIVEPYAPVSDKYSKNHFSTIDAIPKQLKFDIITFWHALEHMINPKWLLTALKKKLTANGLVIVALPNFESHDAAWYGANWAALDVPRHIWHFSSLGFVKLANNTGFELVHKTALPLDVFYICMLSEKNDVSLLALLKGFLVASICWFFSRLTGKHSTLVYVLRPLEK